MSLQDRDHMKTAALSALWGLLLLIAGWGFMDSRDARAETRQEIAGLHIEAAQVAVKVAVLEEAVKNQKEQMDRIESGVNELRHRTGAR